MRSHRAHRAGEDCPAARRRRYWHVALAAALFVALASPAAFALTDSLVGNGRFFVRNGAPTLLGLAVHAVAFAAALGRAQRLVA